MIFGNTPKQQIYEAVEGIKDWKYKGKPLEFCRDLADVLKIEIAQAADEHKVEDLAVFE